jgi:hypothetical protein
LHITEERVRYNKTRLILGILVVIAVAVVALRGLNLTEARGPDLRLPNILAQPVPAAAAAGCQPDHPAFYYGFADLHAQLGDAMGTPLECEHAIHVNGDTRQRTTTGYAYYRKTDNTPAFTNGWDHWALTTGGLVHWSGYVVDPPTARSTTET